MRRSILFFVFILSSFFLRAQDTLACGFESLFTMKPGMSKPEVIGFLNANYPAQLMHTQIEKVPPYKGSSGDTIIKETFTYRRDSTPCFKGLNTLLQLVFADNQLYKAYISTEFPKASYNDMVSNYNSLRNIIKAKWKYENGTKISGGTTLGFGYDYTKTKEVTNKTEKVSLQYVDNETQSHTKGNYIIEVIWANLKDTRMEHSNY